MKRPEIFATIGNSYNFDDDLLEMLIQNGINNFRFNFGKYDDMYIMEQKVESIKSIRNKYNNDIQIMLDIPYPGRKPRIILSNHSVDIEKDEMIILSSWNVRYEGGNYKVLSVDIDNLGKKVDATRSILYSDGESSFDVVKVLDDDAVLVKANNKHTIINKKSIAIGYIEKRDDINEKYINIIRSIAADAIAFSFVTNYKEILMFKRYFPDIRLISKIESLTGVDEVTDICRVSDIMLGRGDLCLTSDAYNLYYYQKKVAEACKLMGSKLYIATGILTSLNTYSRPTQADIIDITNMLMLSPDYLILNYPLIRNNSLLAKQVIDHIYNRYIIYGS